MTWQRILTRWRAELSRAGDLLSAEDWDGLALMPWGTPGPAPLEPPTGQQIRQLRALKAESDALQRRMIEEIERLASALGTDSARRRAARAYTASDLLT